jgi:hypothetical protein
MEVSENMHLLLLFLALAGLLGAGGAWLADWLERRWPWHEPW